LSGRVDLLCVDELGYMELDRRGAELLFQVLTEREEKASVGIASNDSFSGWTRTCIDTTDAIELAETLQLITRWLATDPATLAQSFLAYIGHPAYGLEALRADLDRFTFLLGGNYCEFLTGQDPP
jgi:IstB-like ATP binding protein